jgi:intein/homing endonuclease
MCKIAELRKGQKIIGHNGQEGTVVRKLSRSFFGKMVYLKTKKIFSELISTSDHEIYVLPYLKKIKRRPRFSGLKYGHNVYRYGTVTKKKAEEIRIGDCLCIPITQNTKEILNLDMDIWSEKYRNPKGPYQKSFGRVVLNDDLLYLFGVYVAEGSASSRVLRFSLNAREVHIAERIKKTLKELFSLESSYFVPRGRKNSLEITCCSALLSHVFKEWFGSSSDTKHLPPHLFSLPNDQIRHIVDGYFDGDGHMRLTGKKVCSTVSKKLSFQLFDILNRLKLYPSLTVTKSKNRKIAYNVAWYNNQKERPGRVGKYKEGYYCVPVINKKTRQKAMPVYNLTVTPQHSYVVNLFGVGNCNAKHNIIHLVSFLEGISVREALEKLSGGIDCSIDEESRLVVEELLQRSAPDQPEEFSKILVYISGICDSYLQSVEYDLKECDRIDKIWTIIDNSLHDYDFEKIEKIHAEIGSLIWRVKCMENDYDLFSQ